MTRRLSIGLQEIYLAGAIDSLSTITVPPSAATAKYYNDCLLKKQITAHINAEEMKAIIQTRPELRPKPATGALLALIKLCGLPAPDWPSPCKDISKQDLPTHFSKEIPLSNRVCGWMATHYQIHLSHEDSGIVRFLQSDRIKRAREKSYVRGD
ncbi:MAG TPA: hypothetical protein VHT68_01680 [Pseudolabrys sp.]|nr:hypothetical protein [Pseudolabrys sp.]